MLAQVLPDGTTGPLEDRTDCHRLREMSDADVEAAALSDPDAQPLTEADEGRMRRVPRVKTLRRVLRLRQEESAARYRIPFNGTPAALDSCAALRP